MVRFTPYQRNAERESPTEVRRHLEVDETYVGGKNKNRHENKKVENSQGRSAKDKTLVVGLLERGGRVVTYVVKDTEAKSIQPIMVDQVAKGSTVITDAYRSYNGLGKTYTHIVVKHTEGNYKTIREKHTNNIEGFWSLLKRGIIGIYHYVSLNTCIDTAMNLAIVIMRGKQLTALDLQMLLKKQAMQGLHIRC